MLALGDFSALATVKTSPSHAFCVIRDFSLQILRAPESLDLGHDRRIALRFLLVLGPETGIKIPPQIRAAEAMKMDVIRTE
jgi:hypothetical protein